MFLSWWSEQITKQQQWWLSALWWRRQTSQTCKGQQFWIHNPNPMTSVWKRNRGMEPWLKDDGEDVTWIRSRSGRWQGQRGETSARIGLEIRSADPGSYSTLSRSFLKTFTITFLFMLPSKFHHGLSVCLRFTLTTIVQLDYDLHSIQTESLKKRAN